MRIALIAAMANNRVIGVENTMPWHLSDDLKYFKAATLGKPMICGRKTFESTGRLPGRPNIVISRSWQAPAAKASVNDSVYSANSVEAAIALAKQLIASNNMDCDEIMIAGGAQIYSAALPLADRIYLTKVDTEVEGDALFPKLDASQWQEIQKETHPKDDKHAYSFNWLVLNRI